MALYINKTFRYPLGSGIAHKCQRFFTTKPPAVSLRAAGRLARKSFHTSICLRSCY
ncbi:hypothetical protein K469DRAFT_341417 [Zopfia rhizophila CBS 207.26]|uniref:Uncharacterized protein n=1 Tax=Zopfia rhizophila CBS 207.26 TaxID=1314779 RepID=A0A6A6EL16_9PEZI|nr:hypothetical protein K469DRAFT_341417 [Zopfia rhizophila CBS 207.26]